MPGSFLLQYKRLVVFGRMFPSATIVYRSSGALDSVLIALLLEFNPLGQYDQVVAFVGRHNDDNEIGSSDDNEMVFSHQIINLTC